ncbi:MAG TPA: cyclic nucleotide-binding domain-containing protein [Thermoanaerobaculia bacterium]|jgi:CRP-like cAMP-binding protein/thioredoxin reductase/Fe-S-cluster-containing hydrogenase component 2|nr:cyclic nucleotide-binding domain-containing protein [Thermoanaerobaculia bacterium]
MHDLLIVGSGPAGLAAASHAQANGLSYVVLERAGHLADTIWAYQARKFVMAEPVMIPARGDLPFAAGSRESILEAWDGHVAGKQLNVVLSAEVRKLAKDGDRFVVATADGTKYEAKSVVLAMGTQGNPRKLGVPGDDMPHVLYRLVDPAEHTDQDILVVGAGDSALEIAIALSDDNRVTLIVRGPEITRANEILTKEILSRQARQQMTVLFNSNVKQVYEGYADLNVRGDVTRVAAQLIFLKLGADAPRKFFEGLGIRYNGDRPALTPTHESAVQGLYLIGAASGRDLIKLGMNQGYEVIEHLMGREVEPADEAVLRERLPFWQGTVRERIHAIRQRVPLLAAADEQQLRETFLAARVREYRDGEIIIRQNDYTSDFLIIASGRVELWKRPEQSAQEVKVAELTAGNFFGEMSLISGRRRTATARAIGETRLIEIPRKAILKLFASSPRAKALVDQAFMLRAFGGYLFPGIPEAQLGALVDQATVESVGKDAVVFREGDPADAFYLIRNGMVKISKKSGDKEVILSYLVAGNFFGEAALFSDAERTATVSAIFPSDLIRLSKRDFVAFLAAHHDLREAPLRKLEDRRIAGLIAEATPGSGNILGDLIREEVVMGTQTLIIDEHKCIRCSNCVSACEGVHEDGQARLSLTGIKFYNLLAPNSCWQCENPMCMLDCPPDAIVRDPRGEVYIKSNCIGCGNCERNCPYDNIFMVHKEPKRTIFSWVASLLGKGHKNDVEQTVAVKCDLCREISGGPACVRSCPTGAAIRLTPDEYRSTLEELVITRGER